MLLIFKISSLLPVIFETAAQKNKQTNEQQQKFEVQTDND